VANNGSWTGLSRTEPWQHYSPLTAMAQQAFATEPKYKKYTQQVEKCLNSFDNVHEWADCIAFLKQLLKVGDRHIDSFVPGVDSMIRF
jgi:hypothetical protein